MNNAGRTFFAAELYRELHPETRLDRRLLYYQWGTEVHPHEVRRVDVVIGKKTSPSVGLSRDMT